ncbi:intermembrane lipid transfer protein VPS13B isoform X2 [Prorops nasuta]|uniref:intermembrane lipid transfer protein VPS13B isoform X2 n=1 Tax=Prorops nasuta TaxID=863751 RepID=UPI0034CDD4CF
MFKLESYITPVILSYVEKYVKNFKPEQSQVSLWGGDASFQNLDLRLEVLEEQLNLPFSFVSGHIHELLIHVPWVKITSEPIVVTINTIECILKLKNESKTEYSTTNAQSSKETEQEEAPPGYIKSIVTKVINNITINCNNLILKYVEEDIVLSINVRFLSMQTVNHQWEPAFTDVTGYEVMVRKIITIQDLTLCLDKMDASGKIEIYQDPVLYRCSMTIRLIINYHGNTAKRASVTRLDLHCQKMEFSITEQQVPMLCRLMALLLVLQNKQFPMKKDRSTVPIEEREDYINDDVIHSTVANEAATWGGWAWNIVSSVLPMDWDMELSTEQQIAYSGHIIHLGIYIDDATITFKIIESIKEQVFYKSRKLRYKSFSSLQLNGVVIDTLLQGIEMTSFQIGIGYIRLYPRGNCSCGHLEVLDGFQPPLYLVAGRMNTNYLKDSLFDEEAVENKGKKRDYSQGVEYHLATYTVEKLLDRCPAVVMDYLYCVKIPDDISPEELAALGSNFEESNFKEERYVRYVVGDLTLRLCSGLLHRLETIKTAAEKYDYDPYVVPKSDPALEELPPVTLEEFESLRENVSMVDIKFIIIRSSIQLQLADHCNNGLTKKMKLIENRTAPLNPALTDDPFMSLECDEAVITVTEPMYRFRLASCASRQTDLSTEMFEQCHRYIKIKLNGGKSQLFLTSECHTSIIMPCSAECSFKELLYPQYWQNIDLIQKKYFFRMDGITVTGTKAQLIVTMSIVNSLFNPTDTTNPLVCSSLFSDVCQEKDSTYLELSIENISGMSQLSLATMCFKLNIDSIKIFALNDTEQAFILSGPESDIEGIDKPLITIIVQFPKSNSMQTHPSLISFQAAEIRGSLDPLLFRWLEYHVTYQKLDTLAIARTETQPIEGTLSDKASRKKTFPSLHESVHSTSDKERKKSVSATKKSKTIKNDEFLLKMPKSNENSSLKKSEILAKLSDLYPFWSTLLLNGSIGHIVIYIPSNSMSAIDAHGIEQAKDNALDTDADLQILVLTMPSLLIHSSNMSTELLLPHLEQLPVKLPKSIWVNQTQSFPWTLSLLEFHCYTLRRHEHKSFVKEVSLNATLALTTKIATSEVTGNSLTALALCVHIDNSPIIVSVSEGQMIFMSNILLNILHALRRSSSPDKNKPIPLAKEETPVVLPIFPQTPSTPPQFLYPENTTTTSTVSTSKEESNQEREGIFLTAWIQWTITKIAIKLYVMGQENQSSLKLVLELEDIITSLDLQPVYLKLKNKITTATIFHYVKVAHSQNWDFGEYVGLVLCGREDTLQKGEDLGFFSVTLTRAKSGNVHTRWGAFKKYKGQKKESVTETTFSTNSYITEAVIKMQMVDVILPPSVLNKYMQLMMPLTRLSKSIGKNTVKDPGPVFPLSFITNLNNESLPLIYLEFKGLRLMVPSSAPARYKLQHDLLMFQLDGIYVTPHAENPICRTPLRQDIYQLAAQANILNVPGSAVEDRQYQMNVKGICIHTTTWKNYQMSINKRMSQSYLYTMNENPALEWNRLGNGNNLEPRFSTYPMLTKFDVCLIIAPTIIFKPDTIVCGSAMEVNCLTDVDVTINLDQLKLISTLQRDFKNIISGSFEEMEITDVTSSIAQKFVNVTDNKTQISSERNFDDERDHTKDSGIDFEMSSINSASLGKILQQEISIFPPFEFLVNCGKMTFILYDVQKNPTISEYLIDLNETDDENGTSLKQPLLFLMINQPNIYLLQHQSAQKIQISCFDIAISLGDKDTTDLTTTPTVKDFKTFMIETKNGEPPVDTGIPPSFITIKCEKSVGKNSQFFVNMGRPTKFYISLSRLRQIESINNKVQTCFVDEDIVKVIMESPTKSRSTISSATSEKLKIPDFNLNTKQIVLSLRTDLGSEIIISLSAMASCTSTLIRPDRIYSNMSIDSLIISAILNDSIKVLLNPWCCNLTVYFVWESWQENDALPQIQLQADSESIYLDFSPDQIKILKTVVEDCQILFNELSVSSTTEEIDEKQLILSAEQHYKDDLKAGAFQFIDGNAEELPFPYQVIFFNYPQQAMAWRYPQPRTLTRIHVCPVPFENVSDGADYVKRIPCAVEYWSDCHMAYQRYVDFYLSETESYRLELPDKAPARAVACIWRVILLPQERSSSKTLTSSRALAACLRIDSYFNSTIIPNIQAALNIGVIHISLYNNVRSVNYNKLAGPLRNYTLKDTIPEMQCFATVDQKGAVFVFNKWLDKSVLIDINCVIGIQVLDYGHLTMQEVLEPLDGKFQLSLTDKTDILMTCKPFTLKISPAIAHTLAVSAHLWSTLLNNQENETIALTRYVVANNSDVPIRFGQSGTDDNILLDSKECHFYSWRHVSNQMIRIAVEANAWIWSRPLAVTQDGTQVVEFTNGPADISLFANVAPLSATQKLITFSGQFIISNQLNDNFEMRLVKYESDVGSKVTVLKTVYMISGKSEPLSFVLESYKKMAMRLRFSNIPNLAWTGDIPLQPNVKWGQPWLVKVPLQERGQFYSIWVRIITQAVSGRLKILAVLSPLYKVRSHLPVPANVHIETPSLKTSSSTVVVGRGECQQLYCPGTFEHFHQLTFQLESGVSASDPYVPLSYSSVDQRKFFRRLENEDIDAILKELDSLKDEPKWPFQSDDIEEWIPAEQPQTHVQVKYQDAKLVSSTLLLELQPWCFFINSVGCHLSLVAEDTELCQIPHYGIVTPPKLEGTFHLGIAIGDTYHTSQTLQLARPDWSQSFYMPRIDGLIPVEGNVKALVDCGTSISFLIINSSMHEDMRLVRVSSSHVIGNSTNRELYVATMAVHDSVADLDLPDDLTPYSLNVLPSDNERQATPIVQWHMLNSDNVITPVALYVSLSLGYSWSCPVRVDQNVSRRCISIPNDNTTLPVIVTTQEDKGTIYIIIHNDNHPQLQIENACSFKILIGQSNEEADSVIKDAAHFSWMCKIETGATCHYSLPSFGSRLPDTPTIENSNILLLAILPTHNKDVGRKDLRWSRGINLFALTSTLVEQFVRLPSYGDVKLLMQTRCYTIHISIVPMSQVEVSARDIRSRLLRKDKKELEMIYNNKSNFESPEDDRGLNVQSSSSSTSVTSFYSAQEDDSRAESSLTPSNTKLTTKIKNSMTEILEESEKKEKEKETRSEGSAMFYFHGVTIVIMHDVNENSQRTEVASLSMMDFITIVDAKFNHLNLCTCIGDLQLDNQMFDQGGFDFPVVLISQNSSTLKEKYHYANNCLISNLSQIKENSLIVIDYVSEFYERKTAYKDFHLKIAPISAYIEDTYISSLLDYATSMIPPCFVASPEFSKKMPIQTAVYVPDHIIIDARILSKPLRIQHFIIDPLSILLSVHTSVHLYVALDHSPLHFGTFEKKNLLTTPYRLGNALTMHYLSGAIFGAGWVVGSLEILGSPGGLAQALGSGLRDFVSLPFQGLLQGPWGFIVGITHGSASLMKHITAGTVNSVTKLASSVARNLDRLTLDEEHLQRQEESRRVRPQGMAQGLYQGLTGLGMSVLGAVAGLAHHPLQQVWSGATTTKGLVTGVGLGLVGVVTKPLSGAAELVALTGQGLLQGAGWNALPSPRQRPIVQYTSSSNNASVRYAWRLLPLLENGHDSILHVATADFVIHQGSNRPVTLVLTRQALLLVNTTEDSVEKIFSLKELISIDHSSESNTLCFYCPRQTSQSNQLLSPEREMDQEMRARVAEYVRTSSTGLASISTNSDGEPDAFEAMAQPLEHTLTFYVGSDSRNYLLSLFNIAKRQSQGFGFPVL